MPRFALAARFDQDCKRVTCAEDTRTEILDIIYRWFRGDVSETANPLQTKGNQHGCIFWLDGVAGTGKSTIAQTIADHFNKTHELGASFFCSRDNADCSNTGLVFPTIAYQLGLFNPSFRMHLSDVMDKDPHVQSALSLRQLEKLIINPLHAAKETFQPCIIVIDALDECKDENATSKIRIAATPNSDSGPCYPLRTSHRR